MVALHTFVIQSVTLGGQKWQFQRDVIIEQPLISFTYTRCKTSLQLLRAVKKKRHSYFEF